MTEERDFLDDLREALGMDPLYRRPPAVDVTRAARDRRYRERKRALRMQQETPK